MPSTRSCSRRMAAVAHEASGALDGSAIRASVGGVKVAARQRWWKKQWRTTEENTTSLPPMVSVTRPTFGCTLPSIWGGMVTAVPSSWCVVRPWSRSRVTAPEQAANRVAFWPSANTRSCE